MSIQFIRKTTMGAGVAGLLLAGSALAGNGALLGVQPGHPQINFVSATVPQGATYNGTTLSITGTPVFVTFRAGGAAEVVNGGGLVINANINGSGSLSGGTFTISGTVIDTKDTVSTGDDVSYSGTLLSGTIADYGIVNLGATDLADFLMDATGGTLLGVVGGSGADIAASVTLEGSTFAGSFAGSWSATTVKGDVGPPVTTKPFPCFNFSNIKIKNRSGTTNDEVHISKGGIRLDAGDTFNPATDDVVVTIDGLVVTIPAGSFVQKGDKQDFTYNTASGVTPKIEMRLNLDKNAWEFDLTKGDTALIDTSDGFVDVTLRVGDYEGTQTASITHHGAGSSGSSEASHQPSCKPSGNSSDSATPGYNKLSSIAGLAVKAPSGAITKKKRSAAEIGHPSTVFVDDATGELAIVDTSGGTCLRCGDVVTGTNGHPFTIMRIQGRPNDTLARKCQVYNASCDILPSGQ